MILSCDVNLGKVRVINRESEFAKPKNNYQNPSFKIVGYRLTSYICSEKNRDDSTN
jgi:hypothetical protein